MIRSTLLGLVICVLTFGYTDSPSASAEGRDDMAFLEGLTLVVLETDDIPSMHKARHFIHSAGGRVALMSPPSVLVGWIPFELREKMIGKAGIREIYFTDVLPGEISVGSEQNQRMIDFYNRAVRGEIQAEYEALSDLMPGAEAAERMPDVFDPPPLDEEAYRRNLEAIGLNPQELKRRGILLEPSVMGALGNSDYMTGTASVTLFFVESDGTGSDPNLYTWTAQHMQNYIDGASAGLAWWASKASAFSGCWVTFIVNYYSATDARCKQWVEPIIHDSGYSSVWINNVMTKFGYTSGNHFGKVNAFNTWQRSTYQTDRAYSAFIPYNPPPAPASFTDGVSAFAYLRGPYTVLPYRSYSWPVAQVFAHESGHIFGACDEYLGGCGSCGTCTNGVANGNCEACNPNSRDCMMKANSYSLCSYTPGHVGWGVFTPCSPPSPDPLPTPTATVSYPSGGYQGANVTLTVGGTNFYPGAFVDVGPNIFVQSTTLIGAESLRVDLSIFNNAAPGARDVTVYNLDLQSATLPGAFEVRATTRHYYSPTGGNVFPYATPQTAATNLQTAISATYVGDSVFVPTMTFDNFSMSLDRGALLYGGWNSTFTVRDLENGKTVLNLSGNVTILPGVTSAGLDGFILQNGTGSLDFFPLSGYYGGGVRILNATGAVVANCEIRSNRASQGGNYGAGGGIFALNSSVDIRDNYIWGNTATHGGAVYLHESGGNLSGNTISGNTVSPSTIQPLRSAQGGGVMLVKSAGVQMANNTITSNTGAYDGGGVYAENSSGIALNGDMISYNRSSFGGAGIHLKKSTATCRGVDFFRNTGQGFGAGIASTDSSSITVEECSFLWNNAVLAGAIYAGLGQAWAWVRHNLFVGNSDTNSAGAVYLSGLSDGSLAGNTLDRNASSGGTGGAIVASSPIEVYNNIVVNSTGVGLSCSGTPPTLLAYNLAWNNSGGNYSGCSPGAGSLSADPLFADTAGVDYHLALHSPAIDSGRPGALYEDPDGSRGDMGRYGSHAFVMDQPSFPKNLEAELVAGDAHLSWDRNPEPDVASYAIYGDTANGFIPSASNFVTTVPGSDSTAALGPATPPMYYRISAVDASGYGSGYSTQAPLTPPTAVRGEVISYRFHLGQNVPNPFNPMTRITYTLAARTEASLAVYDVSGRLVRQLVKRVEGPGEFSATWDGQNARGEQVPSGIYFYRLQAGPFVETRKMVLLK